MTDTTPASTYSTYRGAAEAGAPRLGALPGVDREERSPAQPFEVERYDTADHRLAAAGIVLTLHRPALGAADRADATVEQPHWRLDLPEGERTEQLRVPLAPAAPPVPEVPGELAELIHGVVRDGALGPVGQVRRLRASTRLYAGDGRLLGTVIHDQVTIATLGRSTEGAAWTEVELRDTAEPALAATLEQRFAESGLRPSTATAEAELDRLLRPAPSGRETSPRAKPGSAGGVVVDYLAAQVERIAAEDLRVRRGEPDSVHQMRVASRRARSALQTYRRLFDRERIEPIIDGLRELGRALAPARDAEVLQARISDGLAALEPELLLGPVQAQVTRHFARLEAEAVAAGLSMLDGESYARLRTALDELVQYPTLTTRARRPARKELPAHVARAARRLDRAVATAIDPRVTGHERDLAVHTARKAGKRLRYATEVVQPAVGKNAKRFAKRLKGFQRALGEHQDTVVARNALRELGTQAGNAGENGFAFGLLYGQDAARASRIEEELPALWARVWNRRARRWLS